MHIKVLDDEIIEIVKELPESKKTMVFNYIKNLVKSNVVEKKSINMKKFINEHDKLRKLSTKFNVSVSQAVIEDREDRV